MDEASGRARPFAKGPTFQSDGCWRARRDSASFRGRKEGTIPDRPTAEVGEMMEIVRSRREGGREGAPRALNDQKAVPITN